MERRVGSGTVPCRARLVAVLFALLIGVMAAHAVGHHDHAQIHQYTCERATEQTATIEQAATIQTGATAPFHNHHDCACPSAVCTPALIDPAITEQAPATLAQCPSLHKNADATPGFAHWPTPSTGVGLTTVRTSVLRV